MKNFLQTVFQVVELTLNLKRNSQGSIQVVVLKFLSKKLTLSVPPQNSFDIACYWINTWERASFWQVNKFSIINLT